MFCPNCGIKLGDDAKFCPSCGTPANVAPQEPVYTTPEIEPAPSAEAVYTAPEINNQPEVQTPVTETVPTMSSNSPEQSFSQAPVQNNDMNQQMYSNQAFNQAFNQAPVQNNDMNQQMYSNQAFNQAPVQNNMNQQMYAAGGQAQPMYQNPMGMSPDSSQNWGPLMPPKKKSKAPIIITLSVIALLITVAIVVCCIFFCGGSKGGASSAEDAIKNTLDAASKNDEEALINSLFPLYSELFDAMEDSDNSEVAVVREYMLESLIDSISPVDGKFSYSDFEIEEKTAVDKEELDEFAEMYDSLSEQFSAYDIELGNKDDYNIEAGYEIEGTVTIKAGGESEECYFEAGVVKCNGEWYVVELSIY